MMKKSFDDSSFTTVEIPHTNRELPLNYFDERDYQFVSCYRKHFKLPKEAFETLIPRNVRLSEAPSYGMPIHRYDGRCNGATAYRALAKELIGRNEGR